MKRFGFLVTVLFIGMLSGPVDARDTRHMYPLADALGNANAKVKLDGSIKFYFGNQKHPSVIENFGEFMSNKKTNAFNKSDKQACEWVFLSAMLSFQDRAKRMGGNAVINLRSYYKKNLISSAEDYECGAGAIIAGVTFLGEVVKIRN